MGKLSRFRKDKKTGSSERMGELARFGNFVVKSYGDGVHMWIRISTVDGGWHSDYRDDTLKYAWIAGVVSECAGMEESALYKAMESWIVLLYHMAHVWPDADFLQDSVNALNSLGDRASKAEIARLDDLKEEEIRDEA